MNTKMPKKTDVLKETRKLLRSKKLMFASLWCENKFYDGYQAWYPSLSKIFSNIIFFDPQKNMRIYGKEEMNKRFLSLIEREKPDFIFLWLVSDEFSFDTLLKIRKISPKSKILNFFGDDDTQFESFSIYYSLFFDCCLIFPQPNQYYKEYGIKNIFPILGRNFDNYHPINLKKKYDVTFIGTPKGDRYELIKYLKEKGINVRLYGWGWHNYPEFKKIYHGPLNPKDFIRIINESKINLCFSKNIYGKPHIIGKVFEFGACKSFALTEYVPLYLDYFKQGKEIVMFKNKEDLVEKIKYYLINEEERERISLNAYKKITSRYNLDIKFSILFRKLLKNEKEFSYKPIPKLNKKLLLLKKEDLNLPHKELKEKLKEADYVFFKTEDANFLPFKEFIQAYSLEKSKKAISCCDDYIHSESLGDYMMFDSKTAFHKLDKQEFSSLVNMNQLMVDKGYLIKNINKFKKLFNQPINLINEENTIFVSIPLVRVGEFNQLDYESMKKAFQMRFPEYLHPLISQKKLFSSSYPYKLFLSSLNKKTFILKYLFEFLYNKRRFNALLEAYKK